jgi:hypothetical protein
MVPPSMAVYPFRRSGNPQGRCAERTRGWLRAPLVAMLSLGLLLGSMPVEAQEPTPPSQTIGATAGTDDAEETTQASDDGSAALTGNASGKTKALHPLTPLEERELLGDWGDSAGEDED